MQPHLGPAGPSLANIAMLKSSRHVTIKASIYNNKLDRLSQVGEAGTLEP